MKTLGKLKIDSNKLLKEEELQALKGGSMCFYDCSCSGSAKPPYSGVWSLAAFTIQEVADSITQHCEEDGICNQQFCM